MTAHAHTHAHIRTHAHICARTHTYAHAHIRAHAEHLQLNHFGNKRYYRLPLCSLKRLFPATFFCLKPKWNCAISFFFFCGAAVARVNHNGTQKNLFQSSSDEWLKLLTNIYCWVTTRDVSWWWCLHCVSLCVFSSKKTFWVFCLVFTRCLSGVHFINENYDFCFCWQHETNTSALKIKTQHDNNL